jgi:isoleucyl-tRNA synthetase
MAPVAPFSAERLHRTLVVPFDPAAPASVHLSSYPQPVAGRRDEVLEAGMARAVAVTEQARAARTQAGLKVRLPLRRLLVLGGEPLPESLLEVVREEINVKSVLPGRPEEIVEHHLKPDFRALGPRFGDKVNRVAGALRELDPSRVAAGLAAGSWTVTVEGMGALSVNRTEVEVEERPAQGFVVIRDGDLGVALDTRLDEDLEREGRLRELVHRLQNQRKTQGLAVTDRVRLRLGAEGPFRETLESHRDWIAAELLAEDLAVGPPGPGEEAWDVDGEAVTVRLDGMVAEGSQERAPTRALGPRTRP